MPTGCAAVASGVPIGTKDSEREHHMRLKPTIAAAALLAAVAAFLASPASAQQPPAERVAPVCANCHQQSHSSILLTAHGAESDAKGSACQACHGDATQHLQDPKKFKRWVRLRRRPRRRPRSRRCAFPATPDSAARELGGRQAPQGRRDLRQLPLGAPDAVGGELQADPLRVVRGRTVHDDVAQPFLQELRRVPPRHPRRDPEAVAPPDRRGQGDVPGLPRAARLAQQEQHPRRVEPRPVRELPRRQARPVHPRASARDGELRKPATHRTARPTARCSRRSPRHCAPTATPVATRTASTTAAGRSGVLPSNIRFEGSGCVECHRQIMQQRAGLRLRAVVPALRSGD